MYVVVFEFGVLDPILDKQEISYPKHPKHPKPETLNRAKTKHFLRRPEVTLPNPKTTELS